MQDGLVMGAYTTGQASEEDTSTTGRGPWQGGHFTGSRRMAVPTPACYGVLPDER
jgi:hypothetical protein